MTTLHDLTGAQGQFICPDCPKEITDQIKLRNIQLDTQNQIGNIIFEHLSTYYYGGSNELDAASTEMGSKILAHLLKNLSVEEFISLKKVMR